MLRYATPADFDAILALNAGSVHFLSALDAPRLARLHGFAAYHKVVQDEEKNVAAFLLAFREGVDYDSPNYRWFAERYDAFIYIDRVVIAADARGGGIGATLYTDLFEFARSEGMKIVACEFDLDPPNPASQRFHERQGFREVGTQQLHGGKKRVSLQVREIS
ncbi:GNAT family N-acetyltransferase [Pseudolysobacter antarcticus]|uniref:GNAT family N-acetyltransferase n=1 Tax=Pseudolysobacter antarcticus TaxID=2511995 RepID=A0A411HGP4_9GAMM|nr:GNAT family N-acetyltransferase [Pseudolysobacter antarcticus]QBB69614.1 GNAT family N-acetyltransferase [Pseudolysobacter antarcticus]